MEWYINTHKYDNMDRNEIIYALICINNHLLSCLISMLSSSTRTLEKYDINYKGLRREKFIHLLKSSTTWFLQEQQNPKREKITKEKMED